ncbi:hypothetical protein DPMN_128395 [Dreissena polymorpha]|uniref:RING-type domain-containing protein n=1 Tax=Dreissena polymorpha TaxID=45954 RepID=A0A9D4JXC6_DREPO|nr:hypothetical protein DPMN_128395 [Dreissena polymorpha]
MSTPTQATDATENDRNHPMVTSSVLVFSGGGKKSSFFIIPTTNQMTWDDELRLRELLRKPSSEESVVIQGLQSTDLQTTDTMSTSEARSVIEMGYSKTAVQLAIHEYNGKNPTKGALSFSAADLVQILVGCQERGEELPQDLPSEELGARGSSQLDAVSGARLMNTRKCKKCHINDSCMQVLPCNHCCLCVKCARKASHCPMCHRRVEFRFRSYNTST